MQLSAGFVILNYNDYTSTISLVNNLKTNGIEGIVCVVDNCSDNDSFDRISQYISDNVIVLKSDENKGYAAGNNIGCRYLKEHYDIDILFIINPDVRFSNDTIKGILNAFAKFPQYDILTAVMTDTSGKRAGRPYIMIPTFFQNLFLCFHFYCELYNKTHRCKIDSNKEIMDIDAPQGSFFAIRSNIFEKIGYFDEGTFLYFEECCLSKKLKNYDSNARIGLLTKLTYVHDHSTSIRSSISQQKAYEVYTDSKLYFEKKYHHIGRFRQILLNMAIKISKRNPIRL